jgi:hypothetical protein
MCEGKNGAHIEHAFCKKQTSQFALYSGVFNFYVSVTALQKIYVIPLVICDNPAY